MHGRISYGRVIQTQRNLRRKKLHRNNKGFNFLGGSFNNRDKVKAPIQFKRASQPQHVKRLFFLINRLIHFRINSISETLALTGYSCEDLPSRTTWSHLYWEKKKQGQISDLKLHNIRLTFVKKTNMLNPVKSLAYIKCYNSSSPRPVKSPSNSISYNCEKICSWSRRPKTYRKSGKGHFSLGDQQSYYLQVFRKTLLITERRPTGW